MDRFEHTPRETLDALREVGAMLEQEVCWAWAGSFHFTVVDGWTISVSFDSVGRLRVQACRWSKPVVDRWVLAGEHDRLAAVVMDMAAQIRAAATEGDDDHVELARGIFPPG